MQVTMFMAISLDGKIALNNGDEDFLGYQSWLSFADLANKFQSFIVGTRTYEAVENWKDEYGFEDFPTACKIILSRNTRYKLDKGYLLANSPSEALKILQKAGFHQTVLAGGARCNAAFLEAGLIDEIIVNVEPVIVGEGISLFEGMNFLKKLPQPRIKELSGGIVQLQYRLG